MKNIDHIFRAYDIRGLAETELSQGFAQELGRAFGQMVKEAGGKKVSIGRDCRLSGPALYEAVSKGLQDVGLAVYGLGVVPTPVTYFSEFTLKTDASVMITASHNPPEYNGFKMCIDKKTLFGEAIQTLGRRTREKSYELAPGGKCQDSEATIKDRYVSFMVETFGRLSGVSAVVDCGNGVAGIVAKRIFDELHIPAKFLNAEPDGTFPSHPPDPIDPENMKELAAAVKRNKNHVGLGYDGDGDRLGVLTEAGEMVYGDQLLILFARQMVEEEKGATVIGEVKCSQLLFDELERMGAHGIMWRTGHSFIKQKIREEKAALAGEMSGHFFFAKGYLGYDDGIFASLKLLEILNKKQMRLQDFIGSLPKVYNTPEIRTPCPEEKKEAVIQALMKRFQGGDYQVSLIDGIRLNSKKYEGWALVRASNTQPVLVSRFEASSPEKLAALRETVEKAMAEVL